MLRNIPDVVLTYDPGPAHSDLTGSLLKKCSILMKERNPLLFVIYVRWTPQPIGRRCLWNPHPAIVTTKDNAGHISVLLYSCSTTITAWGVPCNKCPP